MIALFVEMLKIEFKKRLDAKTGWGKNEVYLELIESISAVLAKINDRMEENTSTNKR